MPDSSKSWFVDETFTNFESWKTWIQRHPYVLDEQYALALAWQIDRCGFVEPVTRLRVGGDDISYRSGDNIRESLRGMGLNSRNRANLYVLKDIAAKSAGLRSHALVLEKSTPFALFVRALFPICIEVDTRPLDGGTTRIGGSLNENASMLTNGLFDLVVANDLIERVVERDTFVKDLSRLIKPGGWYVGTSAFSFMTEPAPARESAAAPSWSLQNAATAPTGWDILDCFKDNGFSRAEMRFVCSEDFGIVTSNMGVFVLCAQR